MLSTEVLAPTYVLYENGQKVTDKTLLASVVRIVVDERLDQASVCLVELADRQLQLSGGSHFAVGTELKIEMGYVGNTAVLFDGEVTAWREGFPRRGAPALTLIGLDRFHRLKRERKTKTFCAMKDSDIVQQVLGAHNFQVTADKTDATHDYVMQANQSDADFLLARAQTNGHEIVIDGKNATVRKPKLDDAAAVTLKWHEDLTSFHAVISLANAHASVQASSFDMKQKAPVKSKVDAGAEQSAMGGQKTGNQVLKEAMAASEPTEDPFKPSLSQDEMALLAQATIDRDSKKFVTAEGRVPGNVKVRRGTVVEIDGIGDHLSGNYYVSAAVHTLIPRLGYTTVFNVYRTSVLSTKPPPPKQSQPGQAPPPPAAPSGAVEFVVVNQFGDPVDGLDYVLYCPDGSKKTGKLPANGVVHEENALPGVYKLALKGVDQPAFEQEPADDPAGGDPGGGGGGDPGGGGAPPPAAVQGQLLVTVVDAAGQPRPGLAYEVTLPDGSKKTGQTDADGKIDLHVPTGDCFVDFPDLASGDAGGAGGGS